MLFWAQAGVLFFLYHLPSSLLYYILFLFAVFRGIHFLFYKAAVAVVHPYIGETGDVTRWTTNNLANNILNLDSLSSFRQISLTRTSLRFLTR